MLGGSREGHGRVTASPSRAARLSRRAGRHGQAVTGARGDGGGAAACGKRGGVVVVGVGCLRGAGTGRSLATVESYDTCGYVTDW